MPFSSHLLEFVEFVLVGAILGIIFDFFRGYRKLKKSSTFIVTIQDIIYFFIALIIIISGLLLFLNTEIRAYIFIGIAVGIFIYEKIFSNLFINVVINFYKMFDGIFKFLILPIVLFINIFSKIYLFLQKIAKKCCKKFLYMILVLKRVVFCIFKKQKREKYGKKGKSKSRNGKK